jgi:hypothetical protein
MSRVVAPGGVCIDDHRGLKLAAQTFTRDVAMLSGCAA